MIRFDWWLWWCVATFTIWQAETIPVTVANWGHKMSVMYRMDANRYERSFTNRMLFKTKEIFNLVFIYDFFFFLHCSKNINEHNNLDLNPEDRFWNDDRSCSPSQNLLMLTVQEFSSVEPGLRLAIQYLNVIHITRISLTNT